jgi:hypothetical protein
MFGLGGYFVTCLGLAYFTERIDCVIESLDQAIADIRAGREPTSVRLDPC